MILHVKKIQGKFIICKARIEGGGPWHFLDVNVFHSSEYALDTATMLESFKGYLLTDLYDKRRGLAYANIPYARFPDIDSDLIAGSKLGIINSSGLVP